MYLGTLLEALSTVAEVGLVSFLRPSEARWDAQPCTGLAFHETVLLRQNFDLGTTQRLVHKGRMAWRWGVRRLPLLAAKFYTARMVDALARAREQFRPDVLLFEFAIMAQYLPSTTELPTVLTDHEQGPVPDSPAPLGLGRGRDAQLWRDYVRFFYPRARLLQALNEDDAQRLTSETGREVEVRPPVVRVPEAAVAPERAPPRALFLGDYSHRPNPESATFLAREVWPLVRRHVRDAELVLAGPRSNSEVRKLAEAPGVSFVGFAPDLAALLGSARLLLAPVFSGAGSRIKVLTALAHGLPVVSNALGLRGVRAPALAARGAESAMDLAAHTIALLEEPREAGRAGKLARSWAEVELSPTRLAASQLERFRQLIAEGR